MQIKKELAMSAEDAREYVALSREVWEASKTIARDERHSLLEDIYAITPMYTAESIKDSGGYETVDGAAHIPVVGMLTQNASPCAALFGEATTEYGFIETAIQRAENDPSVNEIVLRINSPGGEVGGLDHVGMAIATATKPTRAVVDHIAASAAYWLATQADQITLTSKTNMVGSIGVAFETIDTSKRDEDRGVKRIVFTSTDAPNKRLDPKTDEGARGIVARLDDLHGVFVQRVADGRGVSPETVNESFGRGGMVIAAKALEVGMADEVIDIQRLETETKTTSAGVTGENKDEARPQAGNREVQEMNLEQLKSEYPDLYKAVKAEGRDEERARMIELDGYVEAHRENAFVAEVVAEAKASGKTAWEVNAKMSAAIEKGRGLDGENPPSVQTNANPADKLTDEDRAAAKMMGMTIDEYIKYSGGNQ